MFSNNVKFMMFSNNVQFNKLVKFVYHLFDSNFIKRIVLINTLLHKSFYFISTRSISVAQCNVQSNVYILKHR